MFHNETKNVVWRIQIPHTSHMFQKENRWSIHVWHQVRFVQLLVQSIACIVFIYVHFPDDVFVFFLILSFLTEHCRKTSLFTHMPFKHKYFVNQSSFKVDRKFRFYESSDRMKYCSKRLPEMNHFFFFLEIIYKIVDMNI